MLIPYLGYQGSSILKIQSRYSRDSTLALPDSDHPSPNHPTLRTCSLKLLARENLITVAPTTRSIGSSQQPSAATSSCHQPPAATCSHQQPPTATSSHTHRGSHQQPAAATPTVAATPRSTSSHSPAAFLPEHHALPLGWWRRAKRMWQPASQEAG